MAPNASRTRLTRLKLLAALAVGLVGVLLAACGVNTAAPAAAPAAVATAPAPAPAAAKATDVPKAAAAPAPTAVPKDLPQGAAGKLTVIHRTEYFPAVQERFKKTVEDFAKANNVQLDISTANSEVFGDFKAKMVAAVRAGNPPDISYNTDSIPQLYSLDVLEDVTDVVEEAIKRYGAVVPAGAEQNAKINGRWYAIPFISNSGSWFARKDLLDAKGIPMSQLDTWDGRREAALAISDPSKEIWGWGLTVNKSGDGHGFIMDVIQSFGGSISDASGKKVTFNSPETVAAVKWLAETYTSPKYKPMLPPGVESWTDTSNNEAWLAGKIGFTQNALSIYGQMRKDKNPLLDKTALIRKPQTKDGKVLENGGSGWLTIFKGAKNKEMAKKLALDLLDPKNSMPMFQEAGGLILPAYKNLWTDEFVKSDSNFPRLKDIIFNPEPYYGTSHPAPPSAVHDSVLSEAIPSQMMANVISGKMTPEEAVADAHKKIVTIFEEAGLKQ
ncbi:MAG: extracellular solute-binding protein [Anaerolineae bacterium]